LVNQLIDRVIDWFMGLVSLFGNLLAFSRFMGLMSSFGEIFAVSWYFLVAFYALTRI